MREDFLHFLWRRRRFRLEQLQCTEGQALEILHPGEWNRDAGPDFFNARVRINDTVWAGNVELHVQASEWVAHRHSTDPAYDNVVLHVVYEEDQPVVRPNGERIPCLELKKRIPPTILRQYKRLEEQQAWIPCQDFILQTSETIRLNWLDRMLVERLEQKTTRIEYQLTATMKNWEEAFYRHLAGSFGLKVNTEPFEALARSLPLNLLARHRNQQDQLEALLFGQAGMLNGDFEDKHPRLLAKEYRFLSHKYRLSPLDAAQWKFSRLRPANFPTVRIAQFAALLHRSTQLFGQVLEARNVQELEQIFNVQPGGYWVDHFQFDKPSPARDKSTGKTFTRLLVINTIVPFLFYWGRNKQEPKFEMLALEYLEQLPAETNNILREWQTVGIMAGNAFDSQALIHLKTHWCDKKRCLECALGQAILK